MGLVARLNRTGGEIFASRYTIHKTAKVNMKSPTSSSGENFEILIKKRMKNFWGYGNLKSDIWFVGMEEGFDDTYETLYERFRVTADKQVIDISDDMKNCPDHMKWFQKGAPTQKTYRALISVLLYIRNNKEATLEEIREYQIEKFGRLHADHAILELMPLPSKSIRPEDWLYEDVDVAGLTSRSIYLEMYKPERVEALHKLIQEHKPKLVIFFSRTYADDWKKIAQTEFDDVIEKKLSIAKDHRTTYAMIPHATSFGVSSADWVDIATKLQSEIK